MLLQGVFSLSTIEDVNTIAFLGSKKGEVRVKSYSLETDIKIQCCSNHVVCIAMNDNGTIIATASALVIF